MQTTKHVSFLIKVSGILLLSALLMGIRAAPVPAQAQGGISLVGQRMSYLFADSMGFEAKFESNSDFVDGHLIFQDPNEDEVQTFQADLRPDGLFAVQLSLQEDLQPKAFSTIRYWYVVATEDGTIFESPSFEFAYEDNRFEWQQASNEHFSVTWHSGNEAFGAAILDAATKGITSTQRILPIAGPEQLEIVVYDNQADLQLVMDMAGYEWAAGHSDLAAGRMFVSIAPSAQQSLEIERQVPHEVAHFMLYGALGPDAHARMPKWLDEGIATNAELYSDPIQRQLLELAHAEGSLPSLFALCESFPAEPNLARIAYAQSASFVEYLNREYRVVGVGALVDAYTQNRDCMDAPSNVFGKNLLELEAEWKQATFGDEDALLRFLEELSPTDLALAVGALLVLVLINRWRKRYG